jgi:hypothetical protein
MENYDTLIDFVLWLARFAFYYVLFTFLLSLLEKKLSSKVDETKREELVEKVVALIHRVKQEQHGDVYYWFDSDTDAFLGQGKTTEEIRDHLMGRFKGHIFLIDDKRAMAGPKLEIVPISELTKMPNVIAKPQ